MAWYNASWQYRLPVTVDNTANATSALAYFQCSIALTGPAYTSFHAHAKSDGSDIVVTDSDGVTTLPFALEGIDTANGAVYLLVKLSCPANATKTIYIYYGNPSASAAGSYSLALTPAASPAASVDVYNQANFAGFNGPIYPVCLKNQGGPNGGGTNGTILAPFMSGIGNALASAKVYLATSTNKGASWTTALLATPAATHTYNLRGFGEMADGTIILILEYGGGNNGKNNQYVFKSIDGGATWSQDGGSAAAPPLTNPSAGALNVPWSAANGGSGVGTSIGAGYGLVVQASNGDYLFGVYGQYLSTDSGWKQWILRCPSGSDPTVGSNWASLGIVADGVADATNSTYSEGSFVNPSGNTWICILRNDHVGDLYTATFTYVPGNTSLTVTSAAARMNISGATGGGATSPYLSKLASGNYLLVWCARYALTIGGTGYYGFPAAVSTDGAVTWKDREYALAYKVPTTQENSSTDIGNPGWTQCADGTIVLGYFYAPNAGSDIANAAVTAGITEDWLLNQGNVYDPITSVASNWSVSGSSTAAIDGTHGHANATSLRLDNTVGSGVLPKATRSNLWNAPATNLQPQRGTWSTWVYISQIQSPQGVVLAALIDSNAVTRMESEVLSTSPDLQWYSGSAWNDTSLVFGLNRWSKVTANLDLNQSPLAGQFAVNDARSAALHPQWNSGTGPPSQVILSLGTSGGTTATTAWYADLYTHQYTPSLPTCSAGAEQSNAIFVYAGDAGAWSDPSPCLGAFGVESPAGSSGAIAGAMDDDALAMPDGSLLATAWADAAGWLETSEFASVATDAYAADFGAASGRHLLLSLAADPASLAESSWLSCSSWSADAATTVSAALGVLLPGGDAWTGGDSGYTFTVVVTTPFGATDPDAARLVLIAAAHPSLRLSDPDAATLVPLA